MMSRFLKLFLFVTLFAISLFLVRYIRSPTGLFSAPFGKEQEENKADNTQAESEAKTVIGIDFGTSYSCVGVFRNGRVEIIPNSQGNRITPSYVAFTPENERLIGDEAKNQLTSNPNNTIFDIKRLLGRTYNDPSVQKARKFLPFFIGEKNDKLYIEVKINNETKTFSPEEVSAMILSKMKEIAESYLGEKVTLAVVAVPAYFNSAQRQATKDAGTIAGLNVMRIINEPSAAAMALYAYGMHQTKTEQYILVFDLGGGSLDVSIVSIGEGVLEVFATDGDTNLGGEDFDHRVMDYFMKLYKKKTGMDVKRNNRAVQKLRREVEKAKRTLSSQQTTRVEIENFYEGRDFSEVLSRAKFEELNEDLFQSTMKSVSKVLGDADLTIKDIDKTVLVGGSTRIPNIQKLVRDYFKGKEPNREVNPDEAVAYGAAVLGGVLSEDPSIGNIVLLDVCPLTLGIEIIGGKMAKLIPRNTVIPSKKFQIFSTTSDNQEMVTIAVHEGESTMTKDNHLLGTFHLTGISPAPRGIPHIRVTFKISINGIMEVSAEDKASENREKMEDNRLSQKQIEKMKKDAEKRDDEDKKVRQLNEAISSYESYLYGSRNKVNDQKKLGKILSDLEKAKVKEEIQKHVAWLEKNQNLESTEYKKKEAEFTDFFKKIVEAAQQRQGSKAKQKDDKSEKDEF